MRSCFRICTRSLFIGASVPWAGESDHWNALVAGEPVSQLLDTTAAAGFAGILIDRFGYEDRGASLEAQLKQSINTAPRTSADGRYAFFSLAPVTATLAGRYDERALDELRHPVFAAMEKGCSPLYKLADKAWNWCSSSGALVISNTSHETRPVDVEMDIYTGTWGPVKVSLNGPGLSAETQTNTLGAHWKLHLQAAPGRSEYILHTDAPPASPPGDDPHLIIMVRSLSVTAKID